MSDYDLGAFVGGALASLLLTRLPSGLLLWLLRGRSSRANRLVVAHITAWQIIVLLWFCGPEGQVPNIDIYTLTFSQILWLLVDYSRPLKRFTPRGQPHEEPGSATDFKGVQIVQTPAPNRIAAAMAAIVVFALIYYFTQTLPRPGLAICIIIAATCIIGLLLWITGASKDTLVTAVVALQGGQATWFFAHALYYPSASAFAEPVFIVPLMIFVIWLGLRWTFIVFILYQTYMLVINALNIAVGIDETPIAFNVVNIGIAVIVLSLLLTFWLQKRTSKIGTFANGPQPSHDA